MSFFYKFKIIKSETWYDSSAKLEMSTHEEEVTGEVEAEATEGNKEISVRFCPDLVDEKIKAKS